MKQTILVLGIFAGLLAFSVIDAKPVLVAVDLPEQEVSKWRNGGIPTFVLVSGTAIAEIDDSRLTELEHYSPQFHIIDRQPWDSPYFIGTVPEGAEADLPGEILWKKDNVHIVKLPVHEIANLMELRLYLSPLQRRVLPDRYWDMVTRNIVAFRGIAWEPFIQNLVDQVDTDSIVSYIQQLQDFRTRLALTDSSFAASNWVLQKFTQWGIPVAFDSFYINGTIFGIWPGIGYERNVIATITGSLNPDKIEIICGHMDAIVYPDTAVARYFAPGADDNATATAATMEAARIFNNHTWEHTIKFCAWEAEELGLIGSDDYAERAFNAGLDIDAVFNLDMVGYMNNTIPDCAAKYNEDFSYWFVELVDMAKSLYVSDSFVLYNYEGAWGSDNVSFETRGYPAIQFAEYGPSNPFYHDTTDLLSTLTPALVTYSTKTAVATVAILGLYPGMVEDVAAIDLGDGLRLAVNWTQNPESDVIGYRVYWGLQSETYTDTHTVMGASMTTDTLTGLMTDSTYYITVSAFDGDDRESIRGTEVSCSPRNIPLPPSGVTAIPLTGGIEILWRSNGEVDLAGYRLYRRIDENPTYDSLNIALLQDTTYTDSPLSGEHRYYYAVRAFDTAGNPSPFSAEVYGRPITLDQGILIVDETTSGGIYPADSLQDAFYRYVLSNYTITEFEYDSPAHMPVFADFVPYPVVVWHADDPAEFLAVYSRAALESYIAIGGKLWFTGWKPVANLMGNPGYPIDFSPGSIMYDRFGISHVEITPSADGFVGADGYSSYPRLDVDSAKVPVPTWNGAMRWIEALSPVPPAESIFTMDMENDTSAFEGEICGVRHLTDSVKTVFFGFPLYYMDSVQAKQVAEKVMEDFGELQRVEEKAGKEPGSPGIHAVRWSPNPFGGKVEIRYQLGMRTRVSLKVFNLSGQLVATVTDGWKHPGVHLDVWNGRTLDGSEAANGIYFLRLEAGDQRRGMKIIKIR